MKQTRWNPWGNLWNPLQEFQSEVKSLFDRWGGVDRAGQFGGRFPLLNVWEDADHCFVEAELPGIELKELEILVTGGSRLAIKGERRPLTTDKGVWHRQERAFGRFTRTLSLPFPVDPEKVEARLENGVLLVKLAKHESARPRKITVKAE
jgi:HSP20 family protein